MYQIKGEQLAGKLSPEEREQINVFAEKWQTEYGVKFSNGTHIVMALFERVRILEAENDSLSFELAKKESEHTELLESLQNAQNEILELREQLDHVPQTEENSEAKQELIKSLAYAEPPTDEQLFSDVLEIITTPLESAPTVEIIKEVERKLLDTEILVPLNAKEKELLDTIARYRFSTKTDTTRKSTSELIHAMVFNRGTLFNEHGRFPTFIKKKKLS